MEIMITRRVQQCGKLVAPFDTLILFPLLSIRPANTSYFRGCPFEQSSWKDHEEMKQLKLEVAASRSLAAQLAQEKAALMSELEIERCDAHCR